MNNKMAVAGALFAVLAVSVLGVGYFYREDGTRLPAKAPTLARTIGPLPAPAAVAEPAANHVVAEPVVLLGTFASNDPATGSAIIGPDRSTAGLHRANSEVMPGVWLREVYGNRVVIERNGVREEIMISSDGNRASVARLSTPPAAPPPPSGIADDVRVASSSSNDEQQGVRVFPGRNRGAFAKLGLHPGDLITAINGSPVGGQSSVDVTALLKNGQDTDVTVWRAGRLQQITVHSGAE